MYLRRLLFSLVFLVLPTQGAFADLILTIEQNGVYIDDGLNPINGSFNIVVSDITAPQTNPLSVSIVSAFAQYTNNLGNVLTLGTPTPGTLIVSAPSFQSTGSSPNLRAGATLSNNALAPFTVSVGDVIATVPFSILAGNSGTFTFAGWSGNGGLDAAASTINVSLSGSISVVPEPSSVAFLGFAACGLVLRRRRA